MVTGGHWGGGYSLTGSHLAFGGFRDIFVTAHELGHNFRAYHTHCFNDLPNGGEPEIDRCTSGEVRNDGHACYAGPVAMPPDGGSIMSYCHLLCGGYGNIRLSLGKAGSYGDLEPSGWSTGCAPTSTRFPAWWLADPPLFADGFESGGTISWSQVSPGPAPWAQAAVLAVALSCNSIGPPIPAFFRRWVHAADFDFPAGCHFALARGSAAGGRAAAGGGTGFRRAFRRQRGRAHPR